MILAKKKVARFTQERIKYPVLTVSFMGKSDREQAEAVLQLLATGPEAESYAVKSVQQQSNGSRPVRWEYVKLDLQGRVGVLRRNNVEVALFFKRQITEVTPGLGEPLPEARLHDLSQVWHRFDLLGGASKQNALIRRFRKDMEQQFKEQSEEIARLTKLCAKLEKELQSRK